MRDHEKRVLVVLLLSIVGWNGIYFYLASWLPPPPNIYWYVTALIACFALVFIVGSVLQRRSFKRGQQKTDND